MGNEDQITLIAFRARDTNLLAFFTLWETSTIASARRNAINHTDGFALDDLTNYFLTAKQVPIVAHQICNVDQNDGEVFAK